MRKLFITGIGTDVGKTIVSAIITEALKADYWKPVQAGCEPTTDAITVRDLISNTTSRILKSSYVLKHPMSPHAAAELEELTITFDNIVIPETLNDTVVIEGAGGVLVPLNNTQTVADLITHLNAEVIVVSRFYLGSINHTLLTINELKSRNIKIAGVIFNDTYNQQSADIIEKMTKVKVLGCVEPITTLNKDTITQQALKFHDKLTYSEDI